MLRLHRLKQALATIVLLASAPAAAGPLQEAVAAYSKADYVTALRLWRPLADQGDVLAESYLGRMYFLGRGVPQDYAEAMKWYRLAADQGERRAQANLGLMYDKGLGVDKDHVRAHMWLNLAAAQGDKLSGKYRDAIARERMTPAQIAEAQKLAREWKATRQPSR
jgi:hypothetical protein